MKATLKICGSLLDEVRRDLTRPHAFAHERVGFLTAGAATMPDGILMLVRDYRPVHDEDYEPDQRVGAKIGSNAMRKAAQSAYRPASVLLHVHSHGGRGRPQFSGVDLRSADEFVPGFFETTPRMPHGLLVLSHDSVRGRLWLAADREPLEITGFMRVDTPIQQDWTTS